MCFDNALQMKIIYIWLVIIVWPFLAFYGPKLAIFSHQRHRLLNFETEKMVKMEQILSDHMFQYCHSDKNRLQWIGHNLMAILSILLSKKAILPPEAQNTHIWNKKHGRKLSNLYQTVLQMKIVYNTLVMI